MNSPKYIRKLSQVPQLSSREQQMLEPVSDKFAFRSNEYYQSLIDWDDPNDPIRRIIMPNPDELKTWGALDASGESKYTVMPGLEHKYQYTALLLVNDVCGGYCRFCFRKRIFMNENDEISRDVSAGLEYIRTHKEITNVLLTGGDPLLLSTKKLEKIVNPLRTMDHVKIIRIGSKMPAFNPFRILNDPTLPAMIEKYTADDRRIYIMAHFNHPRELTEEAVKAMRLLQKAGAVTVNQTPMIKGVNDSPNVLAELFRQLSYIGVPPYYVFQCRPTLGNFTFSVRLERAYEIFEQARMKCSGLAKRARFAMSHKTGKIEIVGKTDQYVFMRYHRSANPDEKAKFMILKSNPAAHWFDDYELVDEYVFQNPFNKLSVAF